MPVKHKLTNIVATKFLSLLKQYMQYVYFIFEFVCFDN